MRSRCPTCGAITNGGRRKNGARNRTLVGKPVPYRRNWRERWLETTGVRA